MLGLGLGLELQLVLVLVVVGVGAEEKGVVGVHGALTQPRLAGHRALTLRRSAPLQETLPQAC
mgnify:CR=1 FL=1